MKKNGMILLGFLFGAMGAWAVDEPTPEALSVDPGLVAPQASTTPVVVDYVYKGDQFRDPFIPLTGGKLEAFRGEPGAAFNPAGAELKGIVRSPTGRWAVLRTTDGAIYLVENGKIINSRRQVEKGYMGLVKEKALVVIGPNNEATEFKLKGDKNLESGTP